MQQNTINCTHIEGYFRCTGIWNFSTWQIFSPRTPSLCPWQIWGMVSKWFQTDIVTQWSNPMCTWVRKKIGGWNTGVSKSNLFGGILSLQVPKTLSFGPSFTWRNEHWNHGFFGRIFSVFVFNSFRLKVLTIIIIISVLVLTSQKFVPISLRSKPGPPPISIMLLLPMMMIYDLYIMVKCLSVCRVFS